MKLLTFERLDDDDDDEDICCPKYDVRRHSPQSVLPQNSKNMSQMWTKGEHLPLRIFVETTFSHDCVPSFGTCSVSFPGNLVIIVEVCSSVQLRNRGG